MATFESTKQHNVGEEVSGVILEIAGESHAARVRVTGIVSQETVERPNWMSVDSVGGRLYPLTRTTYLADVIWSRVTGMPNSASNALAQHVSNLTDDN